MITLKIKDGRAFVSVTSTCPKCGEPATACIPVERLDVPMNCGACTSSWWEFNHHLHVPPDEGQGEHAECDPTEAGPSPTAGGPGSMQQLAADLEKVFARHGFEGGQVQQLVRALELGHARKGVGDA